VTKPGFAHGLVARDRRRAVIGCRHSNPKRFRGIWVADLAVHGWSRTCGGDLIHRLFRLNVDYADMCVILKSREQCEWHNILQIYSAAAE
jgi:hypothetical protein